MAQKKTGKDSSGKKVSEAKQTPTPKRRRPARYHKNITKLYQQEIESADRFEAYANRS